MTAKILVTLLGVALIIFVNWYFLFSKKRDFGKKENQR